MALMEERCAIAIMAKAPQAGRSKTRLCPPLAPEEAASLSAAFLADMTATVQRAAQAAPIDGWVAYAPAGTEAALRPHIAPGTQLLLADGATVEAPGVAGFGRALLQTMRSLFARGYGSVCVLNSDSPTLPAAYLADAARLLHAGPDRAVLGPVSDGGYYLLGLRRPEAWLFADIAWSTSVVAAQTRAQAQRAGLDMAGIPPWYDVDDAASLRRLLHELEQPDAPQAPATVRALARLDERLKELT
jgi:rSAM/selenodomain-associated transferase 1